MASYSITAENPRVGDVVKVNRDGIFYCTGRVEAITDSQDVLWIEGSVHLLRTAFLREDSENAWTSRKP